MKNNKKETPKAVKILRIVMPLVGLTIALIMAPIDLLPHILRPLPDSVEEQMEYAIDQGLDGIILYIDQGGAEPEFYTDGVRNKFTGAPANAEDYFKIASIHKLYIATAVAKLVGAGTLSLDDTLAKLLPGPAARIENADEITLPMLTGHRSGIPSFSDQPDWDFFGPALSNEEVLEVFLDLPAEFAPDARYRYSNSNYFLLGLIMDAALGYSHQQYVYDEILAPLGLSHTFFSINEVEPGDVMSGYWYDYDDDLKLLDNSMVATAQDVGIFLRALNDGSLLNEEEQQIYSSLYVYEHDGYVVGYHSKARYYEEIDTVVVQFVNTTGGPTWGVAEVIGGKALTVSNITRNRIVRILKRQY